METRIDLEVATCAECGAVFGLVGNYNQSKKQSGKGFYCPNGHGLTYGDSENKKLKDKCDEAETRLANQAEYIDQQDKTIYNRKGKITKLKKKQA